MFKGKLSKANSFPKMVCVIGRLDLILNSGFPAIDPFPRHPRKDQNIGAAIFDLDQIIRNLCIYDDDAMT